jgi:hypothetical protein
MEECLRRTDAHNTNGAVAGIEFTNRDDVAVSVVRGIIRLSF